MNKQLLLLLTTVILIGCEAESSPQTFSDFRKLVGSSLSEEEKQFVGRWSGEDDDGRWWVINRADHTHSYLERGPDGKESLFAHGSWAIRNGALHVLAWVRNGEKNFSEGMDQLKPIELKQEGAIEGFGVFPISSLRDDEIVYEDGFKERRIGAFEAPEMKPFNTPEALKAFDLLKVYKEASAATDSELLLKEAVGSKSLEERNGLIYRNNKPYSGWAKNMYDSGQVRDLWRYKDGKVDGSYMKWHENGQRKVESIYKDGKEVSGKYWNSKGEEVESWDKAKK